MKVVFVNSIFAYPSDTFPLGIVSLCTILKAENFDVEIVDFSKLSGSNEIPKKDIENCNIELFGSYILTLSPSVISFYTMAHSYHISLAIAEYIKKKNKTIKIIFAGPQASVCAKETLQYFHYVDMVAIGEGENSVVGLMNAIKMKRPLGDTKGLAYRSFEDVVVFTQPVELIDDLDTLPYLDYSFVSDFITQDNVSIEVGRGCPYSCIYCSTKSFWKQKYRMKSNDRIINEISRFNNDYDITKFSFTHDSLTANRKKVMDLCDRIYSSNIPVEWSCSSRVDLLDKELIDKMFNSGCTKIFLGIESGSPKIQKDIDKNLNLDTIQPIFAYLNEIGMDVTYSFIYGFPTETPEDLSETLDLILELFFDGAQKIQLHPLTILRGTEIYETYKDELVFDAAGIYYDFNGGSSASDYVETFKKYPDIFAHFYKISSCEISLDYLDIFVNYFIKSLLVNCKTSSKIILSYFKKNLYNFYAAFFNILDEFIPIIVLYNTKQINNQEFCEKIIDDLKSFVFKYDFGSATYGIRSSFEFDYDYFKFFISEKKELIKTYSFDVFKLMKNYNEFVELKEKINTTIKFIRQENRVVLQKLASI